MAIKDVGQTEAILAADELHRRLQSKVSRPLFQCGAFGPVASNSQLRVYSRLVEDGEGFDQDIRTFVGDETSDKDQVLAALPGRKVIEYLVIVRVPDFERGSGQLRGDGAANGKGRCEAQGKAFDSMLPADVAVRVRDPRLVGDEERAPHQDKRPQRAQRNVVL